VTIHVHQFPCLSDNFGALVHDSGSGRTATIDAPEAGAVLAALEAKGWTLTDILLTHHHADHVQGVPGLKARFPEARIVAPAKEAEKIGGVDLAVKEEDTVMVGHLRAKVIETPGHTAGHIVYWFEDDDILFAGDTLFAMGCGRVFETPLSTMWNSLMKLTHLPTETTIYCGHEYTASNARFALTVDPDNIVLKERAEKVAALRAAGLPTLPTTLEIELVTNPFLRADNPGVKQALGMVDADPGAVFAELRQRKNKG
jgi:hydroxyacylglutathione hydrolase